MMVKTSGAVNTNGKGFRLFCQHYRKKRKSKCLKQLTRKELEKKAVELWVNLDKREKSRYSADANRIQKRRPPPKRNIARKSTASPRKAGRVTKRQHVSPTKQKAINRTYRRNVSKRLRTPSRSRSRSMLRSALYTDTSYTTGATTNTGYRTSTSAADYTGQTSATSQTSVTSCTSGATSYRTSDSSYNQYQDTQPTASKQSDQAAPAKSKQKAPVKKTNLAKPSTLKPVKPPIQMNKRKALSAEKTAASSRPRRGLLGTEIEAGPSTSNKFD